jgi:23S rRNA (uracil1939-C5)-methyltransferase
MTPYTHHLTTSPLTTSPLTMDELTITALGAQGDGVAETAGGVRYVAFALPGERVAAAGDGLPRLLSPPSPDRAEPVCRHFGRCGGCVAQHMGDRLYAEWKRGIVAGALRALAPAVAPLRRVPAGSRRRAVLTARRADGRVVVGYHRRRSNDLVEIAECPVLVPGIVARLPALGSIAALLPAPEVRLTVLHTPAGLDVAIEAGGQGGARKGGHVASRRGDRRGGRKGDGAMIGPDAVAALGRIAAEHGVARITASGETLVELARPQLRLGEAEVPVPPGAFVQAVQRSEAILRDLVTAAIDRAPASRRRIADLFCGVGTFTLALARRAGVLAVDSDGAAVAALADGARHAQSLKPIEAKVRDLMREPLTVRELEAFDAVVLDPPRAGAQAQARELARSGVETVVAVSCDPGTLARDAQILSDGGYAIASVTPIDQFVYAAHVETVAVLTKRAPGRRGTARPRSVR